MTFEKKEDITAPCVRSYHREKFGHLPPAYFVVAELDPLRDESYGTFSLTYK